VNAEKQDYDDRTGDDIASVAFHKSITGYEPVSIKAIVRMLKKNRPELRVAHLCHWTAFVSDNDERGRILSEFFFKRPPA